MTYGAEIWGPPLAAAVVSAGSSALSSEGKAGNESKVQRTKRKLIDQILNSITNGGGAFGDLFNADENSFNKSFVEPAQSRFRNQIAPGIQQEFIASGQQRGTGLEDSLTRAGVDMNSMLNEQYYKFQQDALNRKQNSINSILGQGEGAQNQTSTGQDVMSGLSGFLSSDEFGKQIPQFFNSGSAQQNAFPPDKANLLEKPLPAGFSK